MKTAPGTAGKCPFSSGQVVPVAETLPPTEGKGAGAEQGTGCPFQFRIPAGTLVAPSIWSANREGWSHPDTFDPDRFFGAEAERSGANGAHGSQANFLTFGTGPHACMGYRYAQQQLVTFLALLCYEYSFERAHTKEMHDLTYAPTIYPRDGCPIIAFTQRTHDSKA